MNAQNNDSSPQEILPSPQNVGQMPSAGPEEHPGILDAITHLFHKKSGNIPLQKATILTPDMQPIPPMTVTREATLSEPDKHTVSISDRIAGLFHGKHPEGISGAVVSQVPESIEPPKISEPAQTTEKPSRENLSTGTDERFARLLAEDSVYQSMIRSQDVKNIRLQLSMRYMLLMLAIFIVIAWVVNNRVIMFGFYDFPVLSRIRDALFGVLTGLFCLTVWFGSVAWLHQKIGILILRGGAIILFTVVMVSIYVPFWR